MAKYQLAAPFDELERDIIETLIAGHREYRPDLSYPESHSDMQAAVRGLLRMYDVRRLPLARELPRAAQETSAHPCTHRWTVDGLRNPRPEDKCDGCGATWGAVQAALNR